MSTGLIDVDTCASGRRRYRGSVPRSASRPSRGFTVVSDARRKELYWATYDASGKRVDGPNVTLPPDVPTGLVVGPAADLYDLAGERVVVALDPGAIAVSPERLADLGTEPLYLRRPDAQVSTSIKPVLTRWPS